MNFINISSFFNLKKYKILDMKHHISHKDIDISRVDASIENGLTSEQVNERIEKGAVNVTKSPTNKSYLKIVLSNTFTFINILMFSVAALLIVFVGPRVILNLMFLIIIFFNILIGTVEECKSKHAVEKLKLLGDSKIKVKRDGLEEEIYPKDIVLDDVVILNPGDEIPVDGMILGDDVIEVNESLLTGESVPVKKHKGDILYAGSFVVSGINYIKADKIGNDTYICSIESKAKLTKQPKSKLLLSINKIVKTLASIAIPLAVVVFINEFLHYVVIPTIKVDGQDYVLPMSSAWGERSILSESFLFGMTTISYMIPAGMTLLASIAMTTGVIKLSKSKVLTQNIYAVELLSRINTLCLDKTGTLTDGTMSVESYESFKNNEDIEKLISSYLSAFKSENQTSKAMIARFGKEKAYKIVDTIQFNSSRKYSAVKFKELGWYVLGAPEFLTGDQNILSKVNEYAKNGLRVVLLAKVNGEFTDENVLPGKRENVAMFVIRDTIRPEVYDTMKWFSENDVDIKVISGDNVGTVSYIAKQSGIENWDKVVDFSKLTDKDDLEEIVMNNSIFGRVNPDQKADIIAILKKNKRVVGVTGDGLNDLLAFKQADCSIALANGAAATKNVANLILLDSNFAHMKDAVFEGRRVVNNIQRSSTLFVMKDFLWLLITLMPIFMGITHIIEPTVMTIVNVFITGIASTFLALEPDRTRVKGDFYKNVVKRALSSAFYMFVPVFIIMIIFISMSINATGSFHVHEMESTFFNGEVTEVGWLSIVAICITLSGFVIFFEGCRPFTRFRRILFFGVLLVVLSILYLAPDFYIISGTKISEAINVKEKGMLEIVRYILNHFGSNSRFELYQKISWEKWTFLACYVAAMYPMYIINKKYTSKLIDKLLFSPRDFSDE